MTARLPYFCEAARVTALVDEIERWRGTRWRHAGARPMEMKCGVHGDCLFWVHAFKAIGALPARIEIPDYRQMEAAADVMSTLRYRIMATGRAECVYDHDRSKCLPIFRIGDVLLFTNGMSGAHTGLVIKRVPVHFVHLSQNGFNEEPLNQAHWLANLFFVYRLLESGVETAAEVAA